MSRRIQNFAAAAGLMLASAAALADDRGEPYDGAPDPQGYDDYADVVRVDPLRQQVRVSEPVRECRQEPVPVSQGPFSYNHIGGTLIGGAIGHHVSVDRQRQLYGEQERLVERCDVRYRDRYEERIDGYDVTYEYAGREYVTRLPYDPGERLRVRVDVTPAAS